MSTSPADAIAVGIDSYHDRRTAYVFQLNAAGVQRDMLVFDDSAQDDTWDAVWTGDAAIDDARLDRRVPDPAQPAALLQRRQPGVGLPGRAHGRPHAGAERVVAVAAQPRRRSSASSASSTASITCKPARRLELLPYVTRRRADRAGRAGDPLNEHVGARRQHRPRLKYGLGPAFTLSATINPDFGQVEADPSQVNLSANELFFAEKRPFFLEGVDLFKLPIGSGDDAVEGAFYSRRIGAAPARARHGLPVHQGADATTIYGAAKLTGKTRDGWSVGVLDAVTGEETATIVDRDGAAMTRRWSRR